ncbi:IclR family transcriptional regulator [Bombilactobacillus bombi]|uniref:IclR family transcriptional regulator n=1 Tax=Bombilactobacillus bombi TaxID=1303590 RepID=A0A3R6ZX43_9LACO|nr:IclR family transcriptional regulator [Bombilactobacillus bombi]RHW49744.1 IclR family transcriptional regulator [Bombilactobacillus bombi]
MDNEANYNKTVINTFKVLDAISISDDSIGVSKISKITKLPKTTVYRLLDSLEYINVINKNSSQQYRIGSKIIIYAQNVEHKNLLVQTAIPLMKRFIKDIHENINIGILYRNKVLFLHTERGERFSLQTSLFPIAPLYCSSMGKIFLSDFSSNDLTDYFQNEHFQKRTVNTIIDEKKLKDEISFVRKNGFACENEEYEYGLSCIAVPIIQNNDLIAAASVTGPSSRLKVKGWSNIKNRIIDFGKELSNDL